MNRILLFYYSLPHDDALGIVSKAFNRLMARFLKRILDLIVPQYFKHTQYKFPSGINLVPRSKRVIVSLTSFPARIDDLWIVIECLLRQTYQADKIIIWLSSDQFRDKHLPETLLEQQKRGLEIRFVEGDLKSHKKYLYTFEAYPDDYMVIVDDDLYYDRDLIKNLISLKVLFPDAVVTNRAHQITFDQEGRIENYVNWKHNSISSDSSYFLVQTGGCGTLFERRDLADSYNEKNLIERYIPFADDLWIKVQTLLADRKVATNKRYNKDPLTVRDSQIEKLVTKNILHGGNDEQFRAVLNLYNLGDLEKFKE